MSVELSQSTSTVVDICSSDFKIDVARGGSNNAQDSGDASVACLSSTVLLLPAECSMQIDNCFEGWRRQTCPAKCIKGEHTCILAPL